MTDDDIVRARLKTVGIQEHRLVFKDGPWGSPICMFFHYFFHRSIYPSLQMINTVDGSGVYLM